MTDAPPEDFSDLGAFVAWLRMQPKGVSVAILARAALRAIPVIATVSSRESSARSGAVLWAADLSAGFRASAAALYAVGDANSAAALSAASASAFAAEAAAEASASAALYTAAYAAAAAEGSAAYAAAAEAAYHADGTAYAAAAIDGMALAGGDPAAIGDVCARPIWPDGVPDIARGQWARLKAALPLGEDWEVWTEWYEARLRGDPYDLALESARVLEPTEEDWADPKRANAKLREIIERHKTRERESPASEPAGVEAAQATITEILASRVLQTAYADFEIDVAAKRIRMIALSGDLPQIADSVVHLDWRSRLIGLGEAPRELAEDIEDAAPNVPASLARDLRRYATEASRRPDDVRPGVLDRYGRWLGAAATNDDITGPLGDYLAAKLTDIADAHSAIMRDYHAGVTARLEAADVVELSSDATPAAIATVAETVAEAVKTDEWGGLRASRHFGALLDDSANSIRAMAGAIDLSTDAEKRASIMKSLHREEVSTLAMIARFGLVLAAGASILLVPVTASAVAGGAATFLPFLEWLAPGSVLPHIRMALRWLGLLRDDP